MIFQSERAEGIKQFWMKQNLVWKQDFQLQYIITNTQTVKSPKYASVLVRMFSLSKYSILHLIACVNADSRHMKKKTFKLFVK